MKPVYKLGISELGRGMPGDCSGKVFAIFRRCGVPVLRTTSRVMLRDNASGWNGPTVEWEFVKKAALLGWPMPNKAYGHISIVIGPGDTKIEFYHSSPPFGRLDYIRRKPVPNKWFEWEHIFKNMR